MPAITKNQFGEGTTYYIGTNMNDEGIAKVLDLAVEVADVIPVIGEETKLEVTCRRTENAVYYFVFNFTDSVHPLPACFGNSTDILTGSELSANTQLKPYDALIIRRTN